MLPFGNVRSTNFRYEIPWRIPYILEILQVMLIILLKIGNSTAKVGGDRDVSNCMILGFQLSVSHFRYYQE
jgi:hypothetical protein